MRCSPSGAEAVVEHLLERLAHQPLPGVALVRVVAEVGRLERPADDLRDREHAGDLARVDAAGQQAEEVLPARAAVELVELVRALGRIRPRPVQPVALARQREELRAVLARQHAQPRRAPAGAASAGAMSEGRMTSSGGGGGRGVASASKSKRTRPRPARGSGCDVARVYYGRRS